MLRVKFNEEVAVSKYSSLSMANSDRKEYIAVRRCRLFKRYHVADGEDLHERFRTRREVHDGKHLHEL